MKFVLLAITVYIYVQCTPSQNLVKSLAFWSDACGLVSILGGAFLILLIQILITQTQIQDKITLTIL